MRLTCPNCSAQYEVPDEVIPYEGRDVQCSNCGDTWFQPHPETLAEEDRRRLNAGMNAADNDLPEPEAESDAQDEPAASPPEDAPESAPEAEPDLSLPAEGTEEYPSGPQRQELDSAISEILRQEAEREAQLRTTEGGGLESQPELGLESPPVVPTRHPAPQVRDTRDTREHMARLRGEETDDAIDDAQPAARSEVFPDIEEINSTLRSGGGMSASAEDNTLAREDADAPRSSGFLRGFSVALVIGAILLLIYANAPRIAQSLPQADPALSAYVAMIDQARYWLDARLGDFVTNVLPE